MPDSTLILFSPTRYCKSNDIDVVTAAEYRNFRIVACWMKGQNCLAPLFRKLRFLGLPVECEDAGYIETAALFCKTSTAKSATDASSKSWKHRYYTNAAPR
jgi:hypothetical protein